MTSTIRRWMPHTIPARVSFLFFAAAVTAILLLLLDRVAPLVQTGFGDASWIALISLRVLGFQIVLIAAWRRFLCPQRRPFVTVGLFMYMIGTVLALAFDSGADSPLRLHVALIHLSVITLALGLLRVRSD